MVGANWVLYLLIFISIISVGIIIERLLFYKSAMNGLQSFRTSLRESATAGKWDQALKISSERNKSSETPDLESAMAEALIHHRDTKKSDILTEIAQDHVLRARLQWEKNLAILATIGSNAPFLGLFGTVLGIIKAFHDLSQQTAAGAQTVSSGISEALIATAVGILVAIPAVIAFNLFQRRVKAALAEAEALKSFLIGRIAS